MGQTPLNLPVGAPLSSAITANTGVQVKAGPGVLLGLSVTNAGTSWVVSLYDGTSTSGKLLYQLTVTEGPVVMPPTRFTTGLFVSGTGTAGSLMVANF